MLSDGGSQREERKHDRVRVDMYANTWHIKERVVHIGDAMRVCTLVSKLRAVNMTDLCTIGALYLGMIEYGEGVRCVGAAVRNEDASRVDVLNAQIDVLRVFGGMDT